MGKFSNKSRFYLDRHIDRRYIFQHGGKKWKQVENFGSGCHFFGRKSEHYRQ